jgi:hypothetical protein
MLVYLHSLLLIVFGAVLNEAGVKITSLYFWILVLIIFGILLTYDMILEMQTRPGDKDDTQG